ncbi:S8 family peptidase [Herbihabitans rhizosphaerae]|uniref:S8 family peptidase n=1 Tax=Herbihabitans rhizosphaerae TaxID=1872711 RepID=UPI001F5FD751|nr:S8 family peptidase [Herbihabitans rhizosphaerae]
MATATVIMAAGPAQAARGEVRGLGAPGAVEGKFIVVLDQQGSMAADAESRATAAAHGLLSEYGGRLEFVYSTVLRGFSADMTRDQAERLAADPSVAYVQQSVLVHTAGEQPNPPSWGIDRSDGAKDDKYVYPNEGTGATVYVLDTGIRYSHKTFEGRATSGRDLVDDDDDAEDGHGHGTHVSGTVGGEEYGIAKDVALVGVRVLGNGGSAPDSVTVEGLDWVAKNAKKPAVVNMSLTFDTVSDAQEQAVKNVVAAGVTVVVAAGNNGADACDTSPARIPEIITVGSIDDGDGKSSFSNFGTCLDLFAPGGMITSASHMSDDGDTGMSGTSMASPHVAGAAGVYLSKNPQATPDQVSQAITDAAEKDAVQNPGSGSPNLLLNVTGLG